MDSVHWPSPTLYYCYVSSCFHPIIVTEWEYTSNLVLASLLFMKITLRACRVLAQHARSSGFDSQLIHKVDRLIHGSTEAVEAGGAEVWSHSWLYSKFECRQSYAKACLKPIETKQNKNNKKEHFKCEIYEKYLQYWRVKSISSFGQNRGLNPIRHM